MYHYMLSKTNAKKRAVNKNVSALVPSMEGGPDVFKCSKIDKEILGADGWWVFIRAYFDVL